MHIVAMAIAQTQILLLIFNQLDILFLNRSFCKYTINGTEIMAFFFHLFFKKVYRVILS